MSLQVSTPVEADATVFRFTPSDEWHSVPRSFRQLLLRDTLLTEPSPAVAASAVAPPGHGPADVASEGNLRQKQALKRTASRKLLRGFTGRFSVLVSTTQTAWADGLCGPVVVAYTRWRDVLEQLTVNADNASASICVDRLRRKTANGQTIPAPETLGELFPELGELMRDGSGGILPLPILQRIYAAFTTAFAYACGQERVFHGEFLSEGASAEERTRLIVIACHRHCETNARQHSEMIATIKEIEATRLRTDIAHLCKMAIALDPTWPEVFLVRAGVRLNAGERWQCLEDIQIYLWWSTRQGFDANSHVTAYWRMAEAFLSELETRANNEGALLDDCMFHCLIDQAECSLRIAGDYDRSGNLFQSEATKAFLIRIEEHRAARRTTVEFVNGPVVTDASGTMEDETRGSGSEPCACDYSLPWPIDVSAGLPDLALFSRIPTVGSSQQHEPVDLLLLDFRNILDLLPTLQILATRATHFAQRHADNLHWKYRPKPVHIQVQASSAERLAHTLLCITIAKQIGTVAASEGPMNGKPGESSGQSGLAFTMDETPHDRFLCSLLSAVLFHRTFTVAQRAEVDRILTLLVFASLDEDYMHRTFPWLELDDGRKSANSGSGGNMRRPAMDSTISQQQGLTIGPVRVWGTSLLLCRLRSAWIGWLSTAGGEVVAAGGIRRAASDSDVSPRLEKLNKEVVHQSARHDLLGPMSCAISAAVNLDRVVASDGQGSRISQRKFWALLGHMPTGELGEVTQEGFDDDPAERMRPPDPRLRWRPLLEDMSVVKPKEMCINPCILDPFTWKYESSAIADPFKVFSWCLRDSGSSHPRGGITGTKPWYDDPFSLLEASDAPIPMKTSNEPPAIEKIWEVLMRQLKVLSAVFNAFEAADSAKARAMVHSLTTERQAAEALEQQHVDGDGDSPAKGSNRAKSGQGKKRHVHMRVTSVLRQRVAEEEAEANRQVSADVEKELEGLKLRRHEVSLDLEIRDYGTLMAVREKERDWWGKGGESAVAYREAIAEGATATWNPAPSACAPVHLLLSIFAGSPWRSAKIASYRGLAFDVIDARSLLCSGIGILGMCTWFDSLLKPTPHAYIQTRHCEDLFEHHAAQSDTRKDRRPGPAQSVVKCTLPLNEALLRSGKQIACPTARWPLEVGRTPSMDQTAAAASKRATLGKDGIMRWSSVSKTPRLQPAFEKCAHPQTVAGPREPVDEQIASSFQQPSHQREDIKYSAESSLFHAMVQESTCNTVSGKQMQYLLSAAVRAEPLNGEIALNYLGAAGLPTRKNFLPWDSTLEVGDLLLQNWPANPSLYDVRALGGTLPVIPRLRGVDGSQISSDPLSSLGKFWATPAAAQKAEALGPRLVRIRRLGGHPSLDFNCEQRRCANAAFCSHVINAPGGSTSLVSKCTLCNCAWYCSRSCQAIHRTAHEFECQSLRDLQAACTGFENSTPDENKSFFANFLECILAKHMLMTASSEELFGSITISEDLRRFATGIPSLPPVAVPAENFPERSNLYKPWLRVNPARRAPTLITKNVLDASARESHVLDWVQFLHTPECCKKWATALEIARFDPPRKKKANPMEMRNLAEKKPAMFDVRLTHAHTAAGVIRLLSRWISTASHSPVIRQVIDDGLVFFLITGLSQTKMFVSRTIRDHSVVAVLTHRMALHIAASHEWRALAPSLVPPKQFQDLGLHSLECAQYAAYYAFFQPKRMPFVEMRPLMPVGCIVWGDQAKAAMLSLPCDVASAEGAKIHRLTTFLEVAGKHVDKIQLVDNVELDVRTGKAIFLLYSSVVESGGHHETSSGDQSDASVSILILDAARGLQVIACPVPARELHRCAL